MIRYFSKAYSSHKKIMPQSLSQLCGIATAYIIAELNPLYAAGERIVRSDLFYKDNGMRGDAETFAGKAEALFRRGLYADTVKR